MDAKSVMKTIELWAKETRNAAALDDSASSSLSSSWSLDDEVLLGPSTLDKIGALRRRIIDACMHIDSLPLPHNACLDRPPLTPISPPSPSAAASAARTAAWSPPLLLWELAYDAFHGIRQTLALLHM